MFNPGKNARGNHISNPASEEPARDSQENFQGGNPTREDGFQGGNSFLFCPIPGLPYRYDYQKIAWDLNTARADDDAESATSIIRTMSKDDLFFLMYFTLGITAVNHPFLLDRVHEVADGSNNCVDLWARVHYKSLIKTYAANIQRIIKNPAIRICIFSETVTLATAFVAQIKLTFEKCGLLLSSFEDVFFSNPGSNAPKWTNQALTVKRKIIHKECTLEAWGLDNQPISRHYDWIDYDDVETQNTVATAEQANKLEYNFRLSLNLLEASGEKTITGTPYSHAGFFERIRDDGYTFRMRPGREGGLMKGRSVLLTEEEHAGKLRDMGEYVYSCQILLNPIPEGRQVFKVEDLRYYKNTPGIISKVMIVDAAKDNDDSDYTVITCVGRDRLDTWFLLDMVRDRLDLSSTAAAIFRMVEDWGITRVFYEEVAMQRDCEYIREKMKDISMFFSLVSIKPTPRMHKNDRIKRLQPIFQEHRWRLPETLPYKGRDLVQEFIKEEYMLFPVSKYDDMLDCLAYTQDEQVVVPRPGRNTRTVIPRNMRGDPLADKFITEKTNDWMGV